MKYKFGFTLAETLITLAIIGIVAAITIPVLYNDYHKHQYVSQLKKVYTEVNQALIQLANDYGCPGDLVCAGLFTSASDNYPFGSKIVKKFKVVKDCGTNNGLGCAPTNVKAGYNGSGTIYNYDDDSFSQTSGGYRFIISDGASIIVSSPKADCSWNDSISGSRKTGNLTQTCGRIIVDINGPQNGPNFRGRDIFHFWISNGRGPLLYPVGGSDDNNSGWWKSYSCNDTEAEYCAARIIESNWVMDY